MKCPKCKTEVSKYPIKNPDGSWNIANFFKMDWIWVMIFLSIIFMTWAYQHDIKQYEDIRTDPCGFCSSAHLVCNYTQLPSSKMYSDEIPEIQIMDTSQEIK